MKVGDKVRPTAQYKECDPSVQNIYDNSVVDSINSDYKSWPIRIRNQDGVTGLFNEDELELITEEISINEKNDIIQKELKRRLENYDALCELAQYFAKYANQKFSGEFVADEMYRIIRNR